MLYMPFQLVLIFNVKIFGKKILEYISHLILKLTAIEVDKTIVEATMEQVASPISPQTCTEMHCSFYLADSQTYNHVIFFAIFSHFLYLSLIYQHGILTYSLSLINLPPRKSYIMHTSIMLNCTCVRAYTCAHARACVLYKCVHVCVRAHFSDKCIFSNWSYS